MSIYSVYNLVISGVKQLITTCSGAIEAMLGDTIAKESMNQLNAKVNAYEWILNVVSCIALICSAMLIVPFVMIYTHGVSDTNYKQPAFAYLLCFATFMSCIRLPYQNLVEASGHFKETRNGAIVEAVINIVVSVIFVRNWGCIGVAIGTIVAMTVRTIQYAEYASKFILFRSSKVYIKRFAVSFLSIAISMLIFQMLNLEVVLIKATTYTEWVIYAIVVCLAVSGTVVLINAFFYKNETRNGFNVLIKRVKG